MFNHFHSHARCAASVLAAGAIMVAASCNRASSSRPDASTEPGGTPVSSGASSGADNAAPPGEQAMTAYRGMWNAFVAAAKTPSRPYPGLKRYAGGQALELIKTGLRAKAKAHVVTRGQLVLHPTIAKSVPRGHGRQIKIIDCVDDTHWLEYTKAGRLASDSGAAGRHHTEALVDRKRSAWRVSTWFIEKAGTC